MSSERRNLSEIIHNSLISKDQIDPSKLRDFNLSKKGFIMEETNDNIFDSIIFPEGLQKKNEFNFDDNLSLDNRFKVNKNIIKVITSKFHELFIKIVCENMNLRNELQTIKKEQIEFNYSYKKNEANTTYEKSLKLNNTTNNINIGNLSLQDLQYDNVKEKRNDSFDENEFFTQFKEEEIEVFNAIVNDFNIQINELESKDDFLRREIHKKLEEISKLNTENQEILRKKENNLFEIQNISLKLSEFRAFLSSIPNNLVKKDNTVLIHSETEAEEKINSFTVKEMTTYFETQNAEELNLLVNKDNHNYVIGRLYEENTILKEVVRKLRNDALKCENEIKSLEREFSEIHNIKNNLLEQINNCDKGIKQLLNILETIKLNYGKFVLHINEIDSKLEN